MRGKKQSSTSLMLKPHRLTKRRSTVRSLPLNEWPVADRLAWQGACRPGERLKRGGAASHLKPISQLDLERRYGYFLDYIARSGTNIAPDVSSAFYVTPQSVDGYVSELTGRVSSVTTYGSIHKLRRIVQLLAPRRDLDWLIELENDLDLVKQPKSKFGRFVSTEVLVRAGIQMMQTASGGENGTALSRACQLRDGLMMALLAVCPIRLKNFAALTLGRTFVQTNGTWWIVLPASETKEGRPDERPVPDYLTQWINCYLDRCRPTLARNNEQGAVWIGLNHGTPLTYDAVASIISRTTRAAVGVALSPHMFRTAAASSAALHCGPHRHLGSALLHHSDSATTERHYNRASGIAAANVYATIVSNIRKIP